MAGRCCPERRGSGGHSMPVTEQERRRQEEVSAGGRYDNYPRERDSRRMPMVRWYHPRELVRSGLRAVVAGVFGSYADRREIMASLPRQVYKAPEREELWIDY